MTKQLLFWVIMLIWLLFGGYTNRGEGKIGPWVTNNLFLWALLALLGWMVFGPAIK